MDFLKNNIMPLLGGVLLLGGIYVYVMFFTTPSSATLTASDTSASLSQNLLVTLQNLHTIKLDNTIFGDPAFQSLTDFGVVIPPEAVGRRNPFIPLQAPAVSGAGAAGSAAITLPPTKK